MKFVSTVVGAVGILSTAVNGAPAIPVESQLPAGWTTKPEQDPFYNVPDDVADYPLGHIFKSRTTQNNPGLFGLHIDLDSTRQFVYRSSNSSGAPTSTVATLLLPKNYDPNKLLVYNVAEDAASLDCSTSYYIQSMTDISDAGSQLAEVVPIIFALNKGWPVLVPDFEGPNSAYIAGIQSGHMVLDAIRALMDNQDYAGFNVKDANIALWGYSGGSSAVGWAGELQPSYYPELDLVGLAMGGIVSNISAVAHYDDRLLLVSPVVTLAILGLSNEYPELAAEVDKALKPEKKEAFYKYKEDCLILNELHSWFGHWTDYFTDGIAVLDNPVVKKIMDENTMGKNTPKVPYFAYQGRFDEVVPYNEAKAYVDELCAKGVNIEFHTIEIAEHLAAGVGGVPKGMLWLEDRLNGKEVKTGCNRVTDRLPVNWTDITKGLGPEFAGLIGTVLKAIGL